MTNLFLSPHSDDSVLFGAFTLLREKPLVVIVTDSHIQQKRGEVGCSPDERWSEDVDAHQVLGCPVFRLGLPDDTVEDMALYDELKRFEGFDKIYIPALQGGNAHHDMVNRVAKYLWGAKCVEYTTYTKTELWTKGTKEIVPTTEELELKNRALDCYQSQIRINGPHFEAVRNKSEWIN